MLPTFLLRAIPQRRARWLAIVLLTLLAVWATLASPTIFFDNQILLGPALGVFALLQFGWRGMVVGVAAALCTVQMWGHPWAALVMVLQLTWQQVFLSTSNGGREQAGNGRIVLATILFWLVLGWPTRTVLYSTILQVPPESSTALVLKEAVVSVVNAALAVLLFLAIKLVQARRGQVEVSLRGLTFSTLLLATSIPGILIIGLMGQQVTAEKLAQFQLRLQHDANVVARWLPAERAASLSSAGVPQLEGISFEAVAGDGQTLSSDPALFARLQAQYRPCLSQCPVFDGQVRFLVKPDLQPIVQRMLGGYWLYRQNLNTATPAGWRTITVVRPAQEQMRALIASMGPSLRLLAILLVGSALTSELITTLAGAQIKRILGPLAPGTLAPSAAADGLPQMMPALPLTVIRELNRPIAAINAQGQLVNRLAHDLHQANELLRRSEERHRLLADNALDVITICDLDGRPTYISPSVEKVRGWTVPEAMALPMDEQLTADGCQVVREALERGRAALREGLPMPAFRMELQQSHKDGSWVWTDVTSSPMLNERGVLIGTLVVYRDISERKHLEDELRQLAMVDELTQLLTRRALLAQLEALLAEARRRRSGEAIALLFCDLDFFKEINDRLGHAAGDLVLRTTADRVRGSIRSDDLAARMGGDELVVVLTAVSDLAGATAVAHKIAAAIQAPIHGPSFSTSITASIGVTMARPEETVDELMARADLAMYRAKEEGRSRVIELH